MLCLCHYCAEHTATLQESRDIHSSDSEDTGLSAWAAKLTACITWSQIHLGLLKGRKSMWRAPPDCKRCVAVPVQLAAGISVVVDLPVCSAAVVMALPLSQCHFLLLAQLYHCVPLARGVGAATCISSHVCLSVCLATTIRRASVLCVCLAKASVRVGRQLCLLLHTCVVRTHTPGLVGGTGAVMLGPTSSAAPPWQYSVCVMQEYAGARATSSRSNHR